MLTLLVVLLMAAAAALPWDRSAALWLKQREQGPVPVAFKRITDWAKALWWIVGLVAASVIGWAASGLGGLVAELPERAAAILLGLLAGAAILHSLKFVIGRTRPRDLFRTGVYGFRFFAFDTKLDSFPSGHAQTICGVMTALALMVPAGTLVFAGVAAVLSASRFVVTAHYMSDVFIGAAIGAGAAYAVMTFGFPHLIA